MSATGIDSIIMPPIEINSKYYFDAVVSAFMVHSLQMSNANEQVNIDASNDGSNRPLASSPARVSIVFRVQE